MGRVRVLEMIDSPSLGGGQVNVLALARHLDRKRFDVSVCSGGEGPLADEVRHAGVPYFAVSRFEKRSVPGLIKNLAGILKTNRVDILHTHGGIAGFFGRWAAFRVRTPVIVHTLHGIHYLHYRNPARKLLYVFLEKYFSRRTDGVIFVSEADLRTGQKRGLIPPHKARLVKNGIAFSSGGISSVSAAALKDELGIDPSRPLLGTIARMNRQKGLPVLLRAARILSEKIPKAAVAVIGDGPQRNRLETRRKQWKLEETVFFMGAQKNAERFLPAFDVFVLPSLWEGLPYVLLEAAAAGIPVIASNIGGVREVLVHGRSGYLFEPGNAPALADAAVFLLKNRPLARRLGKTLQREVPSRFPLRKMVKEIEEFYSELAKGKRLFFEET